MTCINITQNKLKILFCITPKKFDTPLIQAGFQGFWCWAHLSTCSSSTMVFHLPQNACRNWLTLIRAYCKLTLAYGLGFKQRPKFKWISNHIDSNKKTSEKNEGYCNIPYIPILISLKISHDFSWKSPRIPHKILHFLYPLNSPKIPINSTGNLREIPEESTRKFRLKFRVDSRFTYNNPSFHVDSPPPSIRHPRGFHTGMCDFARWVSTVILEILLVTLGSTCCI